MEDTKVRLKDILRGKMRIYNNRKVAQISLEQGDQIAYRPLPKFDGAESGTMNTRLKIYVNIDEKIYSTVFGSYDEDLIKINIRNRKITVYEVTEDPNLECLVWERYHSN
ncbi:hypothetical protein HQ489_03895 [Candidatus Woesearchaeota archaeon]|nr:hypothetical protein [Candidatus Woesearchaeota archaeon]